MWFQSNILGDKVEQDTIKDKDNAQNLPPGQKLPVSYHCLGKHISS